MSGRAHGSAGLPHSSAGLRAHGSAGLSLTVEQIRAATSDDVVIRSLLERNARDAPDEVFVTFEDGTRWTRREGLQIAGAAASALRAAGVGHGDRVAVFLPNGPDFLATWWGAALLGAVTFPLNTALRGTTLRRALDAGDPTAVVAAIDLAPRLDELGGPTPTRLSPDDLRGTDAGVPGLDREIGLWDDQLLLMTSGTTGPSKLVRLGYLAPYAGYASILISQGLGPDDVYLIDLPLFHMAACGYAYACLVTRTRMHVRSRPAFADYWEVLRDHNISATVLISSMVPMLLAQPVRPAEREHRVKYVLCAPVPADVAAFTQRFRIPRLLTSWGGTEMGAPVIGEAVPGVAAGFAGHPRPGWEVRLVDQHDQEVPVGAVGEGIVRADRPFTMCSGYFGDDAATARAWRHGWFHTGDLLRADGSGALHFVDRTGDAIRRRGENVSAFEVEAGVSGFPGIAEVAAVPVPSDSGVDHDIKAWIVAAAGTEIDWADADWVKLLEHCAATMPHFMVPRYFELTEELPKSPSAKVQKYLLRERGNTASTWDSVAHGLVVTRRGLEHTP